MCAARRVDRRRQMDRRGRKKITKWRCSSTAAYARATRRARERAKKKRKAEKRLVANVKKSSALSHSIASASSSASYAPLHCAVVWRASPTLAWSPCLISSRSTSIRRFFEGWFRVGDWGAHPIRFSRKGAGFSPLASFPVEKERERERERERGASSFSCSLYPLGFLSCYDSSSISISSTDQSIDRSIEMAVENGAAAAVAALFGEEELRDVSGVRVGDRFVEVTCGCTSARYGDAVGRLRLFASGDLEVCCDCTPGCDQDKLSPAAFEKHSGRETAGRWQNTVWVIVKGDKVALSKTCLLKYYHEKKLKSANGGGGSGNGGRRPPCHRDEFVRCASCGKERRFRLRTKEECRLYHDAAARHDWTCKDMAPAGRVRLSCEEEEERASRKASRGCARAATCKGCVRCVCFGCETCRFAGCGCQTCVDFYRINS